MKRWIAGLSVGLLLGSSGAHAQTDGSDRIECRATGYDVILINQSDAALEPGAEIEWSVPFARKEGVHVLEAELEPGSRVFVSGAMGSNYLGQGADCTASRRGS